MKYESELVSWSNTLTCGIKLIDDQHKELLYITNELFNHCVGNEDEEREYFKKVIGHAVSYTKVHFATEEKIMLATQFDGYTAHKHEHDIFIIAIVDLVKKFNTTHKVSLLEFTRFLKNWILEHIAISDKQYFEHFKKIASRKPDGKLTISRTDIENAL